MIAKNNHEEAESFVICKTCGRKQHQICAMYVGCPTKFDCVRCMNKSTHQMELRKYTVNALLRTKLSRHIENRVRTYLEIENVSAKIHVRVVSSSKKIVTVMPEMRDVFACNDCPYLAKTILSFVEIDGTDVCFFAMFVQEYGSDCPANNARRIYISYIDSVNLFEPKQYRSPVYHEMILGYFDYVKALGYSTVHLWACPPCKGDDYVFSCHPTNQKIPTEIRLENWYQNVFEKGVTAEIVVEWRNISEDDIKFASDIPYFDGDFWPTVMEDLINELKNSKQKTTPTDNVAVIFST